MSTTTQRHRQADTPRSITLSRHRSPLRRVADAVLRPTSGAGWLWVALGAAAFAGLLLV